MLRVILTLLSGAFLLCSCADRISQSPSFSAIPTNLESILFSFLPSEASTGGVLFPPIIIVMGSSGNSTANTSDMLFSMLPGFLRGQQQKSSDASTATVTLSLYSDVHCTIPVPTSPNGTNSLLGTVAQQISSSGALFSNVTVTKAASSLYLKAQAPGFNSACSSALPVSAGGISVTESTLTSSGTSLNGAAVTLTYTARDQYGNGNPTGITVSNLAFSTSGGITGGFSSIVDAGSGVFTTTFTPGAMGVASISLSVTTSGGTFNTAASTSVVAAEPAVTSNSNSAPIFKLFFGTNLGAIGEFDVDSATGLISSGGIAQYTPLNGYFNTDYFALTPDSQFLYLLPDGLNRVYYYATNQSTTGIPTYLGATSISSNVLIPNALIHIDALSFPPFLTASADSSFLYILNPGISAGGSWIDGFSIAGNGLLTSIGGAAVVSPSGGDVFVSTIATDSSGYVYVGAYDNTNSVNFVSSWAITPGGGLSSVGTVILDNYSGPSIVGLSPVITPSGNPVLYIGESSYDNSGDTLGQLSVFSISLGGQLNLIQQVSDVWDSASMAAMAVPSIGNFLYATDFNSNLYMYSIDPNGGSLSTSSTVVSSFGESLGALSVTADSQYLTILNTPYIGSNSWSVAILAISSNDGSVTQTSSTALPIGNYYQIVNNNAHNYSYVISNNQQNMQNFILPLQRNIADGSLQTAFNVPTVGDSISNGVFSSIATNDNQYLYFMSTPQGSENSSIFQYAISLNTIGLTSLTPSPVQCTSDTWYCLWYCFATFNNQYLYVADNGGGGPMIDQYSITNGELIAMAGYDNGYPTAIGSIDTVITPTGSFLYAVDTRNSIVYQYSIDSSTGNLTRLVPSVGGFATNGPIQIVVTQDGHYAYLIDQNNYKILLLSIDQTSGLLSSIGGIDVAYYPMSLVITPNMQYVYITAYDGSLYSYQIGAGMALSPIGSPINPNNDFQTGATAISIDSAYLYIGGQAGEIYQYSIGANGLLTPLSPAYVLTAPGLTSLILR